MIGGCGRRLPLHASPVYFHACMQPLTCNAAVNMQLLISIVLCNICCSMALLLYFASSCRLSVLPSLLFLCTPRLSPAWPFLPICMLITVPAIKWRASSGWFATPPSQAKGERHLKRGKMVAWKGRRKGGRMAGGNGQHKRSRRSSATVHSGIARTKIRICALHLYRAHRAINGALTYHISASGPSAAA